MNNYKGRQKGATNKETRHLKEVIKQFLESNEAKLQEWFDNIPSSATKLKLYTQLLPYVLPKLRTVEVIEEPKEEQSLDLSKLSDKELELLLELYDKANPEN